ncbi:MAG TPA: response regulator transcription factor [Xanthobacteraceae bacterium]|nr:response regulator transcription factor [Xanthobacteraceae bacterium]
MPSALIVDDHPIVLQGCRRVLQDAGIEMVAEARDAAAGLAAYRRERPDVVIIDLAMEGNGLAGLQLIGQIRSLDAHARILVLSMHSDPAIVGRALQAGATGYLLKDTSSEELVKAFANVQAGRPYLSKDLAMQVALRSSRPANPLAGLTPRETQTLELLSRGKSYSMIAAELDITYKTVVNICYQLRQKLDVKTLPELIRVAVELCPTR